MYTRNSSYTDCVYTTKVRQHTHLFCVIVVSVLLKSTPFYLIDVAFITS